jgi:protein SCO1
MLFSAIFYYYSLVLGLDLSNFVSEALVRNKNLLLSVTALTILVVAVMGWLLLNQPRFRNELIAPAIPATEISMMDAHGNLFRLSDQRGKVVLLFFGYTNCPDECPLTLAHIKQALEMLGDSAQDVRVVMVSTDPVRDTPQVMSNYLSAFNPNFIGLTADSTELTKIYQDYGVVVLEGGETHSSYTYVINRQGQLRLTFVPDSAPEDIAHDLALVLANK